MLPELHIGALRVAPALVLAPMSGVTDSPFRRMVKACSGAAVGLVVSEFISVETLTRRHLRSMVRLAFDPSEVPIGIQLFGADPAAMAEAARMVQGAGAALVEVNCGCPVPKVVRRGGGAALLRDLPLLGRIVEAAVAAVDLPVTVKMRAGWDADSINAHETLRVCEGAGAAALAVHGRTRVQLYRGTADWEIVRELVEAASIPVLGSGDIVDAAGALSHLDSSGCAGLLVGRAAITNPWIFREIAAAACGASSRGATWREKLAALELYLDLLLSHYPAKVAPGRMKMMLSRLIKGQGLPDAPQIRRACLVLDAPREMLDTLRACCAATGVLDLPADGRP